MDSLKNNDDEGRSECSVSKETRKNWTTNENEKRTSQCQPKCISIRIRWLRLIIDLPVTHIT